MRRWLPLAAFTGLIMAFPAPAVARSAGPLWATIDECGASGEVQTVGVVARMAANGGPHTRLYVRFQLQYRSGEHWRDLPGLAARFEALGPARRPVTHATRFELRSQQAGTFTLRVVATFQWRRAGRVLYQHVRYSTAGHGNGRYGVPAGFSAATCVVS